MTNFSPASRIFVSIDTPEIASARGLAESLADTVGGIKLGLEFFVGQGLPEFVRWCPVSVCRCSST